MAPLLFVSLVSSLYYIIINHHTSSVISHQSTYACTYTRARDSRATLYTVQYCPSPEAKIQQPGLEMELRPIHWNSRATWPQPFQIQAEVVPQKAKIRKYDIVERTYNLYRLRSRRLVNVERKVNNNNHKKNGERSMVLSFDTLQ